MNWVFVVIKGIGGLAFFVCLGAGGGGRFCVGCGGWGGVFLGSALGSGAGGYYAVHWGLGWGGVRL